MQDDERVVLFFKEMGLSEKLAKSLLWISKIDTKNKKKKKKGMKYLVNIFDDEEDIEEEYDDVFYDILVFPPSSNPPTPNKKSLAPDFMVGHLR